MIYENEDPYVRLATAIAVRAAKDYRSLLCREKKHPGRARSVEIIEVERFFRSQWFYELTGCDGNVIMEKIRREYI